MSVAINSGQSSGSSVGLGQIMSMFGGSGGGSKSKDPNSAASQSDQSTYDWMTDPNTGTDNTPLGTKAGQMDNEYKGIQPNLAKVGPDDQFMQNLGAMNRKQASIKSGNGGGADTGGAMSIMSAL